MKYLLLLLFYLSNALNLKKLNKFQEAKTIINQKFGYGTLSTMSNYKKLKDYPQNSVVAFSCTKIGEPIFCFSSISMHSRNINKNNKISFSINEKNFKNANDSRITFTGNIKKIQDINYNNELQSIFIKSHPDAYWSKFNDFSMYIMDDIIDLSFNGGFAQADKINLKQYYQAEPDTISLITNEILDELNIILKKYFQNILKINAKINIKNIDRYGINLRILNQNSYSNDKILFTKEISTPEELYIELIKILSK